MVAVKKKKNLLRGHTGTGMCHTKWMVLELYATMWCQGALTGLDKPQDYVSENMRGTGGLSFNARKDFQETSQRDWWCPLCNTVPRVSGPWSPTNEFRQPASFPEALF